MCTSFYIRPGFQDADTSLVIFRSADRSARAIYVLHAQINLRNIRSTEELRQCAGKAGPSSESLLGLSAENGAEKDKHVASSGSSSEGLLIGEVPHCTEDNKCTF